MNMKNFIKNMDTTKTKKIILVIVGVILVAWFVFRFTMVAIERRMEVFNPIRNSDKYGTVVEITEVHKQDGVVKLPLVVKNNRAYVSPSRLGKFKGGQKIGSGKIASVSSQIDYDTGMYVIKTSGVSDGVNYAEVKMNGFFIPVYAVRQDSVFVVNQGETERRKVNIIAQDADIACVSGDLHDGDLVILSNVDAGQKINIKR